MEGDLILQLARFIERISAIARTGLAFTPQGFDAERYEDLLREAARMNTALERAEAAETEERRRKRCTADGASRCAADTRVT